MRWKPIKRPANLIGYEVSDTGLIREIATKRPIHEYKSVKGYICVRKYNVEYKVHRIVADHFIRRVTRKLDVHHKELLRNGKWGLIRKEQADRLIAERISFGSIV